MTALHPECVSAIVSLDFRATGARERYDGSIFGKRQKIYRPVTLVTLGRIIHVTRARTTSLSKSPSPPSPPSPTIAPVSLGLLRGLQSQAAKALSGLSFVAGEAFGFELVGEGLLRSRVLACRICPYRP